MTLQPLALVVRQAPYAQRSARAQLDFALAAATLEFPLEIYFLGDAVWQLAEERETAAAGLSRGLKGWAAVATMTQVSFYAEPGCIQNLGAEMVVDVQSLDHAQMADRWRSCSKVMSI